MGFPILDEKVFSKLDNILDNVHIKKIRLEEDEQQVAVKFCQEMEKIVKEKVQNSDSILKLLLNGTTYRGSYYSGVKVGSPDEFDIDIQLKLPLEYKDVRITVSEPGYISINIQKAYNNMVKCPTWEAKYKGLKKFTDSKGYLLEDLLRAELERVFSKQFKQGYFMLSLDGNQVLVKIKKSGPAFTFELNFEDITINIDFVFVIYFDHNYWPPKPVKKMRKNLRDFPNNYWFAVPKPTDNPRSWRLSFPHHETYLLKSNYNLKFIYRLLKALRDAQKWNIASYHINTLFLLKCEMVNEAVEFWKQSKGILFIHMLEKLLDCLVSGSIPFFWDERCNMIANLKKDTIINMRNRVSDMLKQIKNNCDNYEFLNNYILNTMFRMDVK